MNTVSALGDDVMELKSQDSNIKVNFGRVGMVQLSSNNSRPQTLCYATQEDMYPAEPMANESPAAPPPDTAPAAAETMAETPAAPAAQTTCDRCSRLVRGISRSRAADLGGPETA